MCRFFSALMLVVIENIDMKGFVIMKNCCICGKKHNTYLGEMPLCLPCFKMVM